MYYALHSANGNFCRLFLFMADFATPADFKILKFKGVIIMQDNNQDKQRKIYIRSTKQWVPVTEEVYLAYYRPVWRTRRLS